MPSRCELTLVLVARLNFERFDVNEDREGVGDDDAAGEELDVVAIDESPDGEVGSLDNSASSANDKDCDGREER